MRLEAFIRLLTVQPLLDLAQNTGLLRAEIAVCGGTAIGLWLGRVNFNSLRQRLQEASDRVVTATPETAPPPGPGYAYHLPCALLASSPDRVVRVREITPGVLYAGRAGLRFEPKRPTTAKAFDVGPVREVVVSPVELPRTGAARLGGPRYGLQLRWPAGTVTLHVPHIADSLPLLHTWLDELRYGAASAGRGAPNS